MERVDSSNLLFSRKKLVLGIAAGVLMASGVAQADTKSMALDIESQNMGSALMELSQKTGVQIIVPSQLGSSVQVAALQGDYTLVEALNTLVSGTNLKYEFLSDDSVAISEEAASAEGGDEEPDEEVVITGTRLKGHNPASPVITLDREKLNRGGYTSLEDVFRRLPQNFASINPAANSAAVEEVEFGSNIDPSFVVGLGQTSVNLRGLGSGSTLVLVNGRRRSAASSTRGAFVDISSIPLSQVERIEILNDGASAIYGADAVAGVVNIILRKDYEGLNLQLRTEKSGTGGDVNRFNGGYTFAWDGGFLTTSVDLSTTDTVDTNQFVPVGPQGVGDFTDLGGRNWRRQEFGQPATFETVARFSRGQPVGDNVFLDATGAAFTGELPSVFETINVGPDLESNAIRFNGEQELGESLVLDFELSYSEQEDSRSFNPSLTAVLRGLGNNVRQTFIPLTNVNLPAGFDPADHPDGILANYSYAEEFRGINFDQERQQEVIEGSIGLSGDLPFVEDWTFRAGYVHSQDDSSGRQSRFAQPTDETVFPGITQRILDVQNNINVFTDGSDPSVIEANRALLQTIISSSLNERSAQTRTFDLELSGPLFSLPAGEVQAALGYQRREEESTRRVLPRADTDELSASTIASFFDDEREVTAYFAEVGIPLLKDLPLIQDMTLTLAARREEFKLSGDIFGTNSAGAFDFDTFTFVPYDLSDFDLAGLIGVDADSVPAFGASNEFLDRGNTPFDNTSPSARLSWQMTDDFRLRATWGESFLPPSLSQQIGRVSLFDNTRLIPFSDGLNGSALVDALNAADGVLVGFTGANPNLEPQVADTLTYGFDYTPSSVEGLSLSATYSRYEYDNYIGQLPSDRSAEFLEFSDNFQDFPEIFRFNPDGSVVLLDLRSRNLSSRTSETVDILVDYQFDTDIGSWYTSFNAQRTIRLEDQVTASADPISFVDSEFGPSDWAANWTLGWSHEDYSATVVVNHTTDHRVIRPSVAPGAEVPENLMRSSSFTTVDLQFGYTSPAASGWSEGLKFSLGAQNLFNPDFPFVANRLGYAANRVNLRGRVVYLDVTKSFEF